MKKLIVFDLEGTIFKAKHQIEGTEYASTMWHALACRIGAEKEEKETHDKYENGEYKGYGEWVEETFNIHKKRKLKRKTFNKVLHSSEYNEGVVEFFKQLDRSKWIPVIISGGFQELVDKACEELNIKWGFGACEYKFSSVLGSLIRHRYHPCDFKGKLAYLTGIRAEEQIDGGEPWAFVGDGKNDVYIAKKAKVAFGINPHPELKEMGGLIEIKSFLEILPVLDNFDKHVSEVENKKRRYRVEQDKVKQKVQEKAEWSKDGIILIVGQCNVKKGKVFNIAKNYNIDIKKINYDGVYKTKFDFESLENNSKYSYLLPGQIEHSQPGLGIDNSIYAKIENNPDVYPVKLYRRKIINKAISQEEIIRFFEWLKKDMDKS